MTLERHVVDQAIGEKPTGESVDDPNAGKNPAAVAPGRQAGAKGGAARASRPREAKVKASDPRGE
jgi:hypothetical protein